MSKLIEVPFVPKDAKTEYELTVEVEEGKLVDIIEVVKLVSGELVVENPKKFKKKLGKSDWRLIEDNIRYAQR